MKITVRQLHDLIREAIASMGVIARPGDWVAEDLNTGKLLINLGNIEPKQTEIDEVLRSLAADGVYPGDVFIHQYMMD